MRCDILRWWVGRVEVVCLYTVRPPLPVGWQGPPGWLTAAGGPPPPAGRRWPPPWRPVFVRGAVGSRRSARPGRPSVRPRPRGGGRQRDSRPPSPANSARMLARGRLRGCPAECAPRHGSRAASARGPASISRSKASLSSRAASARGPASPWVWSSSACGRLGVRRGRSRRARSSWTRLRPGERALAYMNVARRRVHLGGSAFTWSTEQILALSDADLAAYGLRDVRACTPPVLPAATAHGASVAAPVAGVGTLPASRAPGTTRRRRGSGSRTCAASSRGARCSPSTRRSSPPAR